MTVLPATADTITFNTINGGLNSVALTGAISGGGTAENEAFVGSNGLSNNSFDGATGATFTYGFLNQTSASATSNVVDVELQNISVNGGAAASVTLDGSIVAVSGNSYQVQFAGGVNGQTVNTTGALAGYTSVAGPDGLTYAVKTDTTLSLAINGKQTQICGFIIGGVPYGATPEPATFATSGLALLLIGFAARRKAKAIN